MSQHTLSATHTNEQDRSFDRGLKNFMSLVYLQMGVGMFVTAVVAMVVGLNPGLLALFQDTGPEGGITVLGIVIALVPFGMIFLMSFGFEKLSPTAMGVLFQAFCGLMGISTAGIFAVYTGGSIASVFLTTMIMFLGISLWGYTTKRDLSGLGTFFLMGLIGLIAAMVINIFLASPAVNFAISIVGVLLFAGLTAYDTQQTKSLYTRHASRGDLLKASTMAAMNLYLDLLNLFMFMLSIFGNKK
ncbi:Bax inhibitor-1/YccA family protein [Salipiger sp. PrR003]|uniref:Bax inhibitor-1/YccA family protein n=1 Tax=Salipiger sp. PrR003 TaxID=2706776 RepID=UPI0013D9FA88|nr:Bax inhibitor-1/YccA family protein [Salipiger sp. PrR003]NDV50588.1 Bax inhibitor-1/YccA family protein [Salipiger sp. PrR003]